MNNESEIWHKFLAGDDKAYSSLYKEYVQDLYKFGLCFTSDTDLIKDCIQDLFVYIYSNRNKLDKACHVKTYLLVSLKHNLLRGINRVYKYDSIEEDIPFLSEQSVEEKYIEDEFTQNEIKQIETMLSCLTSRQREVMYYRFVQELPMEEICRLMDLNYQSAQNLIQRSLKKIREEFGIMNYLVCFVLPQIISKIFTPPM